eukprot:TRINITY_DN88007_c2_g1_i1.p1 TRINITY_DN88007_c2_g1~~TRINITY_DN88007_c2_g1_i1.p1  ORF type:complete len:561 (+),score=69.29 TRINITY_DN88007_c2_g1_i1:345-2027(+)
MKKAACTIDLPPVFKTGYTDLAVKKEPDMLINLNTEDEAKIRRDLPTSFTKDVVSFVPNGPADEKLKRKITVAVVFSGGPAPGGHNVVCGIFEAMTRLNPESRLIGCVDGFQGLLEGRFMEITKKTYDAYLNTGGFDMLGSARVKIQTPAQIQTCIDNLTKEGVNALVTIGGDDSNTNAAIMAEEFLARGAPIQVIGIPKTIDGDLKNKYIEQSFGFDTATSIYSSQIGNICRDAKSSRKYWHIIKLMGRDTGHICLECALQTHPNIAIIGEEIKAKNVPLTTVVHHICDGIIYRSAKKENFGVVLFSEGIVENCMEVNQLLNDIDAVKTENLEAYKALPTDKEKEDFILSKLGAKSKESEALYASLPTRLKGQFMIDKDAHGHFQCALIDSEQLLIHLIKRELFARGHKTFNPIHHSFGYEGRCGWPTKFDANYTYALGITGMLLIAHGLTGYLACVRNLSENNEKWIPAGVPLCLMMDPTGKPRIKAIKVDLNGLPFKEYHRVRDTWKEHSDYLYPLPPHLYGPEEIINKRTKTLVFEHSLDFKQQPLLHQLTHYFLN